MYNIDSNNNSTISIKGTTINNEVIYYIYNTGTIINNDPSYHIIDNLTNVVANTEAARSRVQDADFAIETTQLTRNTILQQAATSMVAQANTSKNMLMALIQG